MPWAALLDIILVAVSAISQAVTGILGYRVTTRDLLPETKRQYERLFVGFAIAGVVATILVAYRGRSIGDELDTIKKTQKQQGVELHTINENTKQVPVIKVNPPPPSISPQRAYVHLVGLGFSQYRIGSEIRINNTCENATNVTAQNVRCTHAVFVVDTLPLGIHGEPAVPRDVQTEKTKLFDAELSKLKKEENSVTMGPHEQRWGTYYGPVLDDELDNKLRNGGKSLLFVGVQQWRDNAGIHRNEVCEWLQWHFDEKQIWHDCEIHNQLKY